MDAPAFGGELQDQLQQINRNCNNNNPIKSSKIQNRRTCQGQSERLKAQQAKFKMMAEGISRVFSIRPTQISEVVKISSVLDACTEARRGGVFSGYTIFPLPSSPSALCGLPCQPRLRLRRTSATSPAALNTLNALQVLLTFSKIASPPSVCA